MNGAPLLNFGIVRELRKQAGLTLEEVSRRSRISIGVLSKLERNQSRAELETLYRLASVFDLSAADLLSLAESRTAHRKEAEKYSSGPFTLERVAYENAQCYVLKGAAGDELSRPDAHSDDYEICWVREGKLRLSLPHQTYELNSGEAVQFDGVLEHTYEALEDVEAVLIHIRKQNRF